MTLLFAACATTRADDVTAIRSLLDTQVAAWNRGDLESYMSGYWHSPDLEFFSGSTITRGWQQTLDRYRSRYQSGGHEMGTLTFSDLKIEVLGPNAATASGRWALKMKDSNPNGLFTLILHRFSDGWKIVHDHSS